MINRTLWDIPILLAWHSVCFARYSRLFFIKTRFKIGQSKQKFRRNNKIQIITGDANHTYASRACDKKLVPERIVQRGTTQANSRKFASRNGEPNLDHVKSAHRYLQLPGDIQGGDQSPTGVSCSLEAQSSFQHKMMKPAAACDHAS